MVPLESMWTDLFVLDMSVWEKALRTVLVYGGIALVVRLFGKRLMAQMNSMDLVVVLLLSNVVQNAIIGNDNSVTGGLLGAAILVLVNAGVDILIHRVRWLRVLLEGNPTEVVNQGQVRLDSLRRLGISRDELRLALHNQGADEESDVRVASIEPGGSIVVDLEPGSQSATRADLERELAALRADLLEALQRRDR